MLSQFHLSRCALRLSPTLGSELCSGPRVAAAGPLAQALVSTFWRVFPSSSNFVHLM